LSAGELAFPSHPYEAAYILSKFEELEGFTMAIKRVGEGTMKVLPFSSHLVRRVAILLLRRL
jgi:hypothetical protein